MGSHGDIDSSADVRYHPFGDKYYPRKRGKYFDMGVLRIRIHIWPGPGLQFHAGHMCPLRSRARFGRCNQRWTSASHFINCSVLQACCGLFGLCSVFLWRQRTTFIILYLFCTLVSLLCIGVVLYVVFDVVGHQRDRVERFKVRRSAYPVILRHSFQAFAFSGILPQYRLQRLRQRPAETGVF